MSGIKSLQLISGQKYILYLKFLLQVREYCSNKCNLGCPSISNSHHIKSKATLMKLISGG